MTDFQNQSVLGVSLARLDVTPAFAVGTVIRATRGQEWIYCLLPVIASVGQVCYIDPTFTAVLATTTNALYGGRLGVAPAVSATVAYYGWLQTSGVCDAVQVGASCAANVRLNTTATAGQLDDDGTGGAKVAGSIALSAARAASDGVAAGTLYGSTVGATL